MGELNLITAMQLEIKTGNRLNSSLVSAGNVSRNRDQRNVCQLSSLFVLFFHALDMKYQVSSELCNLWHTLLFAVVYFSSHLVKAAGQIYASLEASNEMAKRLIVSK